MTPYVAESINGQNEICSYEKQDSNKVKVEEAVLYEIYAINIFTKGHLKGYANGCITFYYKGLSYNHKFLYRIEDSVNGSSNSLVCIDYGFKIPNLASIWINLENMISMRVKEITAKKH